MQTKVISTELKVGMYVSSLDRPWIDTPFMLQGFLIEGEEDIKLLKKYCEFVQVDWSRSTVQQVGIGVSSGSFVPPPRKMERFDFIPNNIELSLYADDIPVEAEVAPAVNAHKRANDFLGNLVHAINSNKNFALEETEAVVQEVVDSMVRNPDAMMWVARLRNQDELVYGRGLQVSVYLVALGRHLGLPKEFLGRLCTIGLLLDIGKIKLPKELLLKAGRLTAAEFEAVKSHVQIGLDILMGTPGMHPDVLLGIAQHHERENGSGYPAGMVKEEIHLFGRMAGIVDSFTALTNPRSYAEAIPAFDALQCLANYNPALYQETMLEQFIQAIGVFPVGSMVELSTGEAAVIISHSKVRRLKPRVLIISDANKRPSLSPATLDLLYQPSVDGKSEVFIQKGLPTGAFGLDAREYYLSSS